MGVVDEELTQGANGCEERIFVSVRLRPLNDKEITRNDVSDWECINDNTIIYRNSLSVSERSMYPTAYTFDRVFRHDCSTRKVYEEGAKDFAISVVSGINTTVFAYGQTSSGKTYTMSGITEFAVADIYDYIEKHMEREFVLKFSAMEIYNESVRDLLSTDSTPLRLLDDPERGTTVERLTEETLKDWNHFKQLLSVCEAQRQIGETSLNEASSRSHQILRLTIESSAREFLGNDKSSSLTAMVNFVDLAGSERSSQSLSAGARLKEGCHINRSLLTLGTVIRKLSKGRNGHVPFRDSKLTRILQSSLGGNARTAIICTMSPARSHVEQSRNTLFFASCAKEVTTNAKVNVVVSDKALVKQLQRELERLETELRSVGSTPVVSDSTALLREKDLQIEKLKEEVRELTLQRDLAQTHAKDLLRMVGDDKPSIATAGSDNLYPKLRVRTSWDFENQVSESPLMADSQCLDVGNGSFDASQYSDAQSSSSDDNFLHLVDFDENFPQIKSSSQLPAKVSSSVESEQYQEQIEEQSNYTLEDLCKDVRCIEIEESIASRYVVSTMSDSSPNRSVNSKMLSTLANTASCLTLVENRDREIHEFGSPPLKENKGLNNFSPEYVIPSPEKPSPWLVDISISSSEGLKLTRSRSCKASLMSNLYLEKKDKSENIQPIWFEKEFTEQPVEFQKKLHALKYGAEDERLSRNGSQTSAGSSLNEVLKAHNVDSSIAEKSSCISSSLAVTEQIPDLQCEDQLAEVQVLESKSNPTASAKKVKDVGLDPIENDTESPAKWPSEFKRLQRDIIELWHACNISLAHRTYFFLLFKGDPADSIYMEVEFRRLSFLRQTFSQGNQKTVQDGRTLTPASSMKALRWERQMLSKQMQKKLSRQERERLFQGWGIELNSSHRRLQLAHRLWTDTKDMDHIRESATIVAKLVCYIEPEQAFKEMFCLNFEPRPTSRRSHLW